MFGDLTFALVSMRFPFVISSPALRNNGKQFPFVVTDVIEFILARAKLQYTCISFHIIQLKCLDSETLFEQWFQTEILKSARSKYGEVFVFFSENEYWYPHFTFGTIYGINVCKFVQKLSLRDVQTVAGLLD